jgi:sRNA-binding protein
MGMTSPSGIERTRGAKESSQQLEVLRERWPLAFPIKHQDVRPLAASAVGVIAATMGWSTGYTRGVLFGWKMTAAYCRAVLSHDQRIALDGAPAEPVDAKAKDLATKRLAQIAAKAAKKAAAVAKRKPAPPPATPAPLRDQVRASLLRRGA